MPLPVVAAVVAIVDLSRCLSTLAVSSGPRRPVRARVNGPLRLLSIQPMTDVLTVLQYTDGGRSRVANVTRVGFACAARNARKSPPRGVSVGKGKHGRLAAQVALPEGTHAVVCGRGTCEGPGTCALPFTAPPRLSLGLQWACAITSGKFSVLLGLPLPE